jgi:glycine cleavage system H protein
LAAGEIFGEVESVKAVSDLYAPISGEVIEINTSLPDDLDALSEDPFGRGWMIKLAVTDTSAADHLFDEAGYRDHCNSASH